jgi:putative transposase
MAIRKRYPAEQKAKIVLEIIREEKTVSQVASEHGIHPTQLNRWKNQVLEDLPKLFSDERNALEVVSAGYEKQIQELYAEVGRLTTQLNWLKKNLAFDLTLGKRLALIKRMQPDIPIMAQTELYVHQPIQPQSLQLQFVHCVQLARHGWQALTRRRVIEYKGRARVTVDGIIDYLARPRSSIIPRRSRPSR